MTERSAEFFITGAAGFIGRELCRQLRAAGHGVRGLVRRPDGELAALGVEQVSGDVTAAGGWMQAVVGMQAVVHCAAHAAFPGGAALAENNLRSTQRVIEAIRAAGPKPPRLVFVSSIGAVDRPAGDTCAAPLDPLSPARPASAYGRSKAAGERLVEDSGLPFCIVRPAMVVGAAMRPSSHFAVFARMALRGSPVAWFAWPGRFSVVHVADAAAALVVAATHPEAAGRTFFCAGEPVAVAECFRLARPDAARLPLRWAVPVARVLPFALKAMLLPALTADDSPLRALGWSPRRSAAEALREVIARERARLDVTADPGGQTVITGAASGLGRALAERLVPHRRQLLLVDRDAAGLARLQAAYPHARTASLDLADEVAVAAFTRGEAWTAHPVAELFACAGLGLRGAVELRPAEDHERLFKVNLLARLRLAHAALPGMRRAGFGRIVFISSSSAFQPLPGLATYAASNAALLSLGEAWAAELAGSGVDLLTVCPGGMQTNFQAAAGVRRVDGEKLMPPDEAAGRILHALPRGSRTLFLSARTHGMALAARLLPRAWSVALWRRLMAGLR